MNSIMYYICIPLGMLMKWCWQLVGNYGLAIILFTLATKIILLPLTVWIHKNSILMVKIQPELNMLKVKHYGDANSIADGQIALFKRAKYRPALSLVPLILQVVLLLAVIFIINHPMNYLLGMSDQSILLLAEQFGANTESSSFQFTIIEGIKNSSTASAELDAIRSLDLSFLGLNLSAIASQSFGIYLMMPALTGLSSCLLCLAQNAANVLQHEQSKLSQYATLVALVCISLFLGYVVPAGTALYWTMSNLFSIAQMYILNAVINPKKYVDYEALERSREEIEKLKALEPKEKKDPRAKENKKREAKDYRRFFRVKGMHLVIYSEKSGFYKYFKALIEELLKRSNITVHYVTNDPDDVIFSVAESEPRIKAYYIGLKKTIPLMMRLEADMAVMTTPDLDKYYLKKSIMRKDIEYVYIPHALMSMHMGMKEGCLNAFDTIFCAGPHIKREMLATEKVYSLPKQRLVEFGYPLAEDLIEKGREERAKPQREGRKEILIAPTWNEDNILDSCIDELLGKLLCDEYHITVRPHPEYVKRYGSRMQAIVDRFADKVGEGLSFELDFSSNKSIYSSDLMITDWSGISFEYSFSTGRPVLFVNTKMKVLNENWQNIGCEPIEITLRDEIGISIEKSDVKRADEIVADMLSEKKEFEEKIDRALKKTIYNLDGSARVGAKYILETLVKKRAELAKLKLAAEEEEDDEYDDLL